MLTGYVHVLTLLLWIAVVGVIVAGAVHGLWIVLRDGFRGVCAARQTVAAAVVSGLGLTTAIALLSTTELRTWSSIGMFTAALGLRTFVKYAEKRVQ